MTLTADDAKENLLHEIDELHSKHDGVNPRLIAAAIALIIAALLALGPKIYLSSAIYYLSLETDTLYGNYKSLKEENIFLQQKVEGLRYQSEVASQVG